MSRKREHARLRAIANVLATASGLGAFAVAVGQHGLQDAVELCATRKPSKRLLVLWDTLGYTVQQLPTAEDIRCLLLGIEATRRQEVARANGEDPIPLFVMADDMDCLPKDIHRGQQILKGYGGSVSPRTPAGRALGVI